MADDSLHLESMFGNAPILTSRGQFQHCAQFVDHDKPLYSPNGTHWPAHRAELNVVEVWQLLCWPTKQDLERTRLLSPDFYGPEFRGDGPKVRGGSDYANEALEILKKLYPFVSEDCIRAIRLAYRQFSAANFVLANGLNDICTRFGVATHRELRSLAKQWTASESSDFRFRSCLTLPAGGARIQPQHELQFVSIRQERNRATIQLTDFIRMAQDSSINATLALELEWYAYHSSRPHPPNLGFLPGPQLRPRSLVAAPPLNRRPNFGWNKAFCLARKKTAEGRVEPDLQSIQCLVCLANGMMTTIGRHDSRTHRIMTHLESFHQIFFVKINEAAADLKKYLDDLKIQKSSV